ncbi:MAG: YebC/PmpR family DNA-binding transcriptional regulator [Candidatus Saccharibacteria bacterium]|nr:YebC/PmpR family DNA-binding transcriptional regulator [Candidatus Saccharibacteria bacterium]
MAGHSKWAKIKRDKASNDAKRGTVFTKLGNQIAIAARQGTDPSTNTSLALAIETARSFNMPQSTIDRAVKRVADKSDEALEEIVYEAYAHGGVALLIQCATNNRKRTYPEIKASLSKYGGSIADVGSVIFNFQHLGEIIVTDLDDDQMLQFLELGVEDISEIDNQTYSLLCPVKDFHRLVEAIKDQNIQIEHAGLTYKPKTTLEIDDSLKLKLNKLLAVLEDLPDSLNIYTNLADG